MGISAKEVMELRQKTGVGMMECKKALQEADGDFDAAMKLLREKGMAKAAKRSGREANEGRVEMRLSDDAKSGAMIMLNSETDFVAKNDEFISLAGQLAEQALKAGDKASDKGLIDVEALDTEKVTELAGKIGENLTLSAAAFLSGARIASYVHSNNMLGVLVELTGDADALASDEAAELGRDLAMQIAASSPDYVRRDEVPADVMEKEKEIYKTQMRNEGKPEEMLDKIATGKLNKFYEEACLLEQPFVKEPKQKVADRVKEVAGGKIDVARFVRLKIGEGVDGE